MLRRITLSSSPYKLLKNKQQLEASNQKIKIIDQLPNSISKRIRSLRLSHNLISKIDNIAQFVFLEEIDLSFNAIRDGQQILSLLQLTKLNKLFIDGNPFLLEPLDQNVMEFLVEKQTDIQILSGQALNNIKQLQQSELKVVFLQNYLKKMDYHNDIKARRLGKTQALKKNPQKQQLTNKLIIDKIMPQFYTVIDDPKIKTRLKKQAIQLKKQQNLTFDEAMKKRKQQQQQKVNNLIKDILILVQQQQQEKQHNNFIDNSSINKQQANTKLKQKFKRIQQNSGRDQSQDFSNAFRRKLLRIKNNNKFNQQSKQQSNRNSTNFGRHMLDTDLINFDNTLSSKSKSFLLSPKQKQIRRSNLSPYNLKASSEQNFYSFNKTTPMPFSIKQVEQNFKNENNQIKYETQHQTKYQTKKIQPKSQMKQPEFLQEYILNSTRRNQTKPQINPNSSNIQYESMGQQISPNANDMYDQYYTHLTKYNPSFALLYSQVSSLSHEQKSVLIQALAKDHKNKTIQLFMERLKVRNLKQISIDNGNIHQKEINQLNTQITQLKQNYDLSRKYAIQLQKQNSRLEQLIKVVTQDIMDAKEQNNNHKKSIKQKNLKIQVLEYKLKQKVQEIQHFDSCEDIAEIIKENSKKRIKNQIFKVINKRAAQNTKIIKWKKKRQYKNNIKLLNISWSLLKKHLLIQVLAKMKNCQKNSNTQLLFFQAWKQEAKIGKQIAKKIQIIKYKIILKNNLKYLLKKKQQKVIKKKQNILHHFWAHHHFVKKIFFKLKLKTKLSAKENERKQQNHSNLYKQLLKARIFQKIKQIAAQTETIIKNMEMKHKNNKINNFYYKLRKLYIQNLVNKQKFNNLKSIYRILKFQLEDKRKQQAIKLLKNENQEIKLAINSTKKMFKQNNLKRLIQNTRIKRIYQKISHQSQYLNKTLLWNRFIRSQKKHKNFIHKIQLFFIRTNKIANKKQSIALRKTYLLENKLKVNKIKVAFLNLFRNSYENKIYAIRVRQRIQQQQTQQLLQKMKSFQHVQIEAIKSQHQNYINILQQKDIRKQVEYRNQLMLIQNNRNQLQDAVRLLKKQVTELKQRQNLFFKQKQLIQDQIIMIQEGKASLNHLNQNLRTQLNTSNLKYQRMLELYTQAMIQLQKKDKLAQYPLPHQKQKQRDKTLQKQKRQIGVVKSNEIINQRNRIH